MTILSSSGQGVAGAPAKPSRSGRRWATCRRALGVRGRDADSPTRRAPAGRPASLATAGRSRTARCAGTRWYPVSLPARVVTLVVAFLAVVAGVLWVVFDIVGSQPQ